MKKLFWPAWIDVVMMILLHPHKKEDKSDIYVNKEGGVPSEVHLKPVLMRYNFSKQNCNAIR